VRRRQFGAGGSNNAPPAASSELKQRGPRRARTFARDRERRAVAGVSSGRYSSGLP
jgi:hypothetical protein